MDHGSGLGVKITGQMQGAATRRLRVTEGTATPQMAGHGGIQPLFEVHDRLQPV